MVSLKEAAAKNPQMLPVNGPRMQAAQRMFRPRHKASADSEIQRGEEVLLHDLDHAGDGHPPVTLDIVAANERASAAANPPYKLAQLDIIDHT